MLCSFVYLLSSSSCSDALSSFLHRDHKMFFSICVKFMKWYVLYIIHMMLSCSSVFAVCKFVCVPILLYSVFFFSPDAGVWERSLFSPYTVSLHPCFLVSCFGRIIIVIQYLLLKVPLCPGLHNQQ